METGADDRFEWDPEKNRSNIRKHGVKFSDVIKVFDDPSMLEIDATEDEYREDRFIAIGRVDDGQRVFIVVFTERPNDVRRIISARRANTEHAKRYYLRLVQGG